MRLTGSHGFSVVPSSYARVSTRRLGLHCINRDNRDRFLARTPEFTYRLNSVWYESIRVRARVRVRIRIRVRVMLKPTGIVSGSGRCLGVQGYDQDEGYATDWKKTVDSFFSDFGRPNAPCVLLANKSDVANDKKFANVRSSSKMADVVRDHGYVSWHAVSAQEGDGLHDSVTVSNAFDSLIDQMLEWDAAGKYEGEDDGTVKLEDEEVSQGGGCC